MNTVAGLSSNRSQSVVDRALRGVVERVTDAGPPLPVRVLAPLRREAMERAVVEYGARAAAAGTGAELAEVAEAALAEMRRSVASGARERGGLAWGLARADVAWADGEGEEYLDDPALDEDLRHDIMDCLDRFNLFLATYDRFFDSLRPLLRPDGCTRVLDLAAGHGGFAREAARRCRAEGLNVHFTATDLKGEYLDMGRTLAEAEGLPVDFAIQDALDLSNLEPGAFDVIMCTQSLHHFPPGLIARMSAAATAMAGRGVLFVDGCRGVRAGLGAVVFGTARLKSLAWVHDAWVSLRKCFVPEELELLVRLGAEDGYLEAGWTRPGFCQVRWQRR